MTQATKTKKTSKEEILRKTKIVGTIGPASRDPKILRRLVESGLDVARLNFSHGQPSDHLEVISNLRKISSLTARPVAILQDLAGPKIRIGTIKNGPIFLEPGQKFVLTDQKIPGDSRSVSVNYPGLAAEVRPGDHLLLSDGALELEVETTTSHEIHCRVLVGGPLSSHKGINLPTSLLKTPVLSKKDKLDLALGLKHKVDYLALSFIRNADDILAARKFMQSRKCNLPIIAKIEKQEALKNIDDIIAVADGLMIARGDLGVEISLEKIPLVQKWLINKSNQAGKPVITATQMLRSMVDSPRPTRAEVTDVANAILDGTDAVMLSEETAVGKYPVEAVAFMARIAKDAESGFPFDSWASRLSPLSEKPLPLPEAVSQAATNLARSIEASAIITFTRSGSTALLTAKYRPQPTIIAPTPSPDTFQRLALVWGVTPVLTRKMKNTDELFKLALEAAQQSGLVKKGDKVVIMAGLPLEVPGATNLIRAEVIK